MPTTPQRVTKSDHVVAGCFVVVVGLVFSLVSIAVLAAAVSVLIWVVRKAWGL